MRRFVVLGHTQASRAPIPLNDAPGAGGRWDLLARCVTSALLVSHGVRRDTEAILVLVGTEPRTLRVRGDEVRRLNPDERSTLALLSKALEAVDVADYESRSLPGLSTARHGFERVLGHARDEGEVVWLKEDGAVRLEDWRPASETVTWVLSDHRDPAPAEAELLARTAHHTVTLGPVAVQADQAIAVVHNRLDRIQRNL